MLDKKTYFEVEKGEVVMLIDEIYQPLESKRLIIEGQVYQIVDTCDLFEWENLTWKRWIKMVNLTAKSKNYSLTDSMN